MDQTLKKVRHPSAVRNLSVDSTPPLMLHKLTKWPLTTTAATQRQEQKISLYSSASKLGYAMLSLVRRNVKFSEKERGQNPEVTSYCSQKLSVCVRLSEKLDARQCWPSMVGWTNFCLLMVTKWHKKAEYEIWHQMTNGKWLAKWTPREKRGNSTLN